MVTSGCIETKRAGEMKSDGCRLGHMRYQGEQMILVPNFYQNFQIFIDVHENPSDKTPRRRLLESVSNKG